MPPNRGCPTLILRTKMMATFLAPTNSTKVNIIHLMTNFLISRMTFGTARHSMSRNIFTIKKGNHRHRQRHRHHQLKAKRHRARPDL